MAKDVSQKVADFFSSYKTRRLDKKQTLIQADFEPDGVYYLIKGQVGQCDIDQSGNELIINVFKKGSFFPLKWALDQQASPFYFLTLSSVTYVRAPRHEVIEFLRREPDVVLDVLSRVYSGAEGLLRKNAQLMGGDARSRVLLDLIITFERFGTKTADGDYLIPINEVDLAKHTGLARETISRQIATLKKKHGITVSREGMRVTSIDDIKEELGMSDLL